MPRDELLRGYNVAVQSGELRDGRRWIFTFADRHSGDTIRFAFDDDVRDYIVRELTGGIVLAGGDLPKV